MAPDLAVPPVLPAPSVVARWGVLGDPGVPGVAPGASQARRAHLAGGSAARAVAGLVAVYVPEVVEGQAVAVLPAGLEGVAGRWAALPVARSAGGVPEPVAGGWVAPPAVGCASRGRAARRRGPRRGWRPSPSSALRGCSPRRLTPG